MTRYERFADDFARAALTVGRVAEEFGTSTRQVRRYLAGECDVPKLAAERMRDLAVAGRSAFAFSDDPAFRFIDLFAEIGGLRIGFEAIGGRCVFTSEWDRYSEKTYHANFADDEDHVFAGDYRSAYAAILQFTATAFLSYKRAFAEDPR